MEVVEVYQYDSLNIQQRCERGDDFNMVSVSKSVKIIHVAGCSIY